MDTLIGVIAAAVLVLPGFVTQELTVRGRPSSGADGQTLIQRGLFYSVVIQLIWSWDTWRIIRDLSGHHWHGHLGEVVVWLVLVVVVSPVLLGFAINEILTRAESGGGRLTRFHYALGGRDAREAWDCFFAMLDTGGWVLVRLISSEMFIGRYGLQARHAQSPAPHDVYFDEVWSADTAGKPIERIDHLAGMWISADRIEAMFPLPDDRTDSVPDMGTESLRIILDRFRLVVGYRPRRPKRAQTQTVGVESQIAEDSQSPLLAGSAADSSGGPAPLP